MNKLICSCGAVVAAVALLSACGGGGGETSLAPAANVVPDSALASPEAYTRYVGSLAPDDQSEPLLLTGVVAPVSDNTEPIPLG
ncbi:MAG: hypothetical protein ABI633_03455 [Burkholderiales bacterium]